jgi:hypothetical protein
VAVLLAVLLAVMLAVLSCGRLKCTATERWDIKRSSLWYCLSPKICPHSF